MERQYNFTDERTLFNIIGKNVKYYRRLYSLNHYEMTQ